MTCPSRPHPVGVGLNDGYEAHALRIHPVARLVVHGAALGVGFALGRALWRWFWRSVGLLVVLLWLGLGGLVRGCTG
jgi:hypothetical protein